jgi:hypothetical protein
VPTDPHEAEVAAFLALLGDVLDEDLSGRSLDDRLVEDLGWDSLALAVVVEALLTRRPDFDSSLVDGLTTLRDVHHFYGLAPSPSGP